MACLNFEAFTLCSRTVNTCGGRTIVCPAGVPLAGGGVGEKIFVPGGGGGGKGGGGGAESPLFRCSSAQAL